MSNQTHPIPVAASLVINRRTNKILLGRRICSYENGLWGFPGGKQDMGETIAQTAKRELFEETGLSYINEPYLLGCFDQLTDARPRQFISFIFACDGTSGQLVNKEPHKCMGWEWIDRTLLINNQLGEMTDLLTKAVEMKIFGE